MLRIRSPDVYLQHTFFDHHTTHQTEPNRETNVSTTRWLVESALIVYRVLTLMAAYLFELSDATHHTTLN